jgi:hypothetical protein
MFSGNADKVQVQGGQMILSVSNSIGCLDRWRYLIDKNPKNRKDQFPLMEIWKEQQKKKTNNNGERSSSLPLQCEIVRMQQEGYISFPNKVQIEDRVSQILNRISVASLPNNSTLVHIKNTGSAGTELNETFHEIFVRSLLHLPTEKEDHLGITGRMHMKATKSDMKNVIEE